MEDEEELSTCVRCGDEFHDEEMNDSDAGRVCDDCIINCTRCGYNEFFRTMLTVREESFCDACVRECDDCNEPDSIDNLIYLDQSGEWFHEGCTWVCEECDERTPPGHDYCTYHSGGNGIRHYGHTVPTKWWGGPVPKDDKGKHLGFYGGLELEVYSSERSALHVHQWAKENGLEGFFDCKEDSSVSGYEIATQPWTPEFFESINWEGFFEMLNEAQPLPDHWDGEESSEHGLHVHIGRIAFDRDPVATAAYCYLLVKGDQMERIGRREAYHYCAKVKQPVKTAIFSEAQRTGKQTAQHRRIQYQSEPVYVGRDAINLGNRDTIEIRAPKSTRDANEFRNAIRMAYVSAEYIRYLRKEKLGLNRERLAWTEFCRWAAGAYPEAFASLAGLPESGSNKMLHPRQSW